MHYILVCSIGRNLAGSQSSGFGSFPCRSHLIMTNLKVACHDSLFGKRGVAMCMCVTDLNSTVSPPFRSLLLDLNENLEKVEQLVKER